MTIAVMVQKLRADGMGVETAAPMNDFIESASSRQGKTIPLYLVRHRIRTGKQSIRIIVPQEPSHAGVDPFRKLIERQRGDNVVEVETGG